MIEKIVNKFTVYDSEEVTALELIESLGNTSNQIIDELNNKTDLNGDHKGSWQGLSKPTLSDEGMRATVEKLDKDVSDMKTTHTVEMFGAKGDGVTDDTQAFVKAFQETRSLELGNKTYMINETLRIPKNMRISGQGIGVSTIKMFDGKNLDMLQLSGGCDNVTISNLTLDHGNTLELPGNKISTIKIDDNSAEIHDEHHLIENVMILGTADYGIWLTNQVRETRLSHVINRGNNRINCFYVQGTDNFIHNCTAVGAKGDGFNINGSNNKVNLCKAFYNDKSGFYINNCNMIQLTSCESQENGTEGLKVYQSNHSQFINVLLDTNGRNREIKSANLLVDSCLQDKFIITCNQYNGLNGSIDKQIKLLNWNNQHNFNISCNTDNKSDIFEANAEQMISNFVICNGKEIKPYYYDLVMKPSEAVPKVSDGFRSVEYDSNGGATDTSRLIPSLGYQKLSGVANGQWQGVKVYTVMIPYTQGNMCYNFQGYCKLGNIEIRPCFYTSEGSLISEGEKRTITQDEPNRDVNIVYSVTPPSNTKKVGLKIACFNNEAGGSYEGYIKTLKIMSE